MILREDFSNQVSSFVSSHKEMCILTLGLAIVVYAVGILAGRTVSWIKEHTEITKKTHDLHQKLIIQNDVPPHQKSITNSVIVKADVIHKKEPMKTYKFLKKLEEEGIPFKFIPFDQSALVHILDPNWEGSCNILSHSWMYEKTRSQNLQTPTSYEITDSHLPHPMIVRENLIQTLGEDSQDVQDIKDQFKKSSYSSTYTQKYGVERETNKKSIDALVEYLGKEEAQSILITTRFLLSKTHEAPGHACAFVKRGDECSWFDPNCGEINFEKFDHFAKWFKMEVMEGTLTHILTEAFQEKKEKNKTNAVFLSEIYPELQFSDSIINGNPLAKSIVERRNKDAKERELLEVEFVASYDLDVYKPNKDTSPLPEI